MKTVIRPEEEMKDSGVQWIGDIPRDWDIVKLGNLGKIQTGNTPDKRNSKYYSNENGILWVKAENLGTIYSIEETSEYITEAGVSIARIFDKNTVFVCCIASIGKCGYSSKKCSCNQQINGISFDKLFWKYGLYMTIAQEEEYLESASGNVVKILNTNKQKNIKCPVPSLSEQQVIANYLDEKCSKIDEIISESKASIEDYKELKQSVIFEAVTTGLDKNVEMKNSSIEGMGLIPEKWSVVRFMKTNYVRARLGWKGLKAEEYVDTGYPFLSAYHIVNNHLNWENLNYITAERYDESPEIKLSIGDLLLVKDGAGIGKCARIDDMPLGEATVNSSLSVITPNKSLDYRYVYYYFLSPLFQNIITRLKNGMGVPHLTQESMKDIYLPLPSKIEQEEIVDFLDKKTSEIDSLISEKQSLIKDLEAYKKSLIYEVVTGKRRVV